MGMVPLDGGDEVVQLKPQQQAEIRTQANNTRRRDQERENNSNHVAAVQWLEDNLPANFMDDSETDWIGIFRTKPPTPEVLAVPYYNQVDNYRDAHRTCNSSSCAMCLAFLKPGSIKGDDEYVKKVFAIGDTTDHADNAQTIHYQKFH